MLRHLHKKKQKPQTVVHCGTPAYTGLEKGTDSQIPSTYFFSIFKVTIEPFKQISSDIICNRKSKHLCKTQLGVFEKKQNIKHHEFYL